MKLRETLQNFIRRVRSSGFLKSVLTLSSGAVVGQAINFFGMPVVGRVYTPEAMGDYTVITTNAGVIGAVACLGMMTVFLLPERDEEARGLSRLVLLATVAITTLAVLFLWVIAPYWRIFSTEETPYTLALVVLWLYNICNTVSNICYAYANRHSLYRVLFWNPVLYSGVNVALSILFGMLNWGFLGYTLASILAFVVNIAHLMLHGNAFGKVEDPDCRPLPLLKSYRRFPVYQMPANLISSLGTQIPVQMMERYYSSAALGMYSMALKVLSLPTSLLATPVNRVYFQEASQRYNRGEDIGEFSFKILKANIKIAIIPISILIIFGEWIFALFLGEQWREAGTYAAILGVSQIFSFCAGCLSGCFVIVNRNQLNLADAVFTLLYNAGLAGFMLLHVPDVYVWVWIICILNVIRVLLLQGVFLKITGVAVQRYLLFILCYVILPLIVVWGIRLGIHALGVE